MENITIYVTADRVCTWPVAPLGEAIDCDDFLDTVIIGSSALYPLAKGAIQMLIIIIIISTHKYRNFNSVILETDRPTVFTL